MRSILFNIVLYLWTLISFFPILILMFFPKKNIHIFARFWSKVVVFFLKYILDIRIKVMGQAPTKPSLFALNHQSALETLIFHLVVPNTIFVLKRELFFLPIFGMALFKMGHIGINRKMGRRAIFKIKSETKARLSEKYSVAIFPEGTRCPVGKIGKIGSGILMMQEATKQPIYPVKIQTGHLWGKNTFFKKSGLATLNFKKPIAFEPGKTIQTLEKLKNAFES